MTINTIIIMPYLNGNFSRSNIVAIYVNEFTKVIIVTKNVEVNNCFDDLLVTNGTFDVLII